MVKNFVILILGILCGIAVMYPMLQKPKVERPKGEIISSPSVSEDVKVLDFDTVYDQLREEQQGKVKEKTWFEKEIDQLDEQAQKKLQKMQKEGDDASKLFEKFADPTSPANPVNPPKPDTKPQSQN